MGEPRDRAVVDHEESATARLPVLQVHCIICVAIDCEIIRVRRWRKRNAKFLGTFQVGNYILQRRVVRGHWLMGEAGDVADGKGDIRLSTKSSEGDAAEEILIWKTLRRSCHRVMVHVKRETDVRVSRNTSRMNVAIAILEEETFNITGLVEEDGAKSSVASDM